MNFEDLEHIIEHLLETCKCVNCKKAFEVYEISVTACTRDEALLTLFCEQCNIETIVTTSLTPTIEVKSQTRHHQGISNNEVLDIKNFLSAFDGDFKKIFNSKEK